MVETTVEALLEKAYDSLKTGAGQTALDEARAALETALGLDPQCAEVVFALKCVQWWQDRLQKLEDFQESFDQGGYVLSQWKGFYSFLDRINGGGTPDFDTCLYAVRRFVFSAALGFFKNVLGDGENQHDPGILLQVGRCYKGIGSYDLALKYLEQARRFKREDGETLSELADVNALLEETKMAKVLFREAFFVNPQSANLRSMESEMIVRLRDRVAELGFSGPELLEWMPIYGCLFGVFSIKRELKPVELGRLKQSIFTLENELRSCPDMVAILKPRLINRYFWLIDHYENTLADPGLIEETMLKIKIIDPVIYERYIR
ncbi:MAG: hypothetical protein LBT11_05285 [Treponema sp.]|jgi:tetratricopeptide (TPR) repeat protein|nr:hypothetical protein [Treponema sp.]